MDGQSKKNGWSIKKGWMVVNFNLISWAPSSPPSASFFTPSLSCGMIFILLIGLQSQRGFALSNLVHVPQHGDPSKYWGNSPRQNLSRALWETKSKSNLIKSRFEPERPTLQFLCSHSPQRLSRQLQVPQWSSAQSGFQNLSFLQRFKPALVLLPSPRPSDLLPQRQAHPLWKPPQQPFERTRFKEVPVFQVSWC